MFLNNYSYKKRVLIMIGGVFLLLVLYGTYTPHRVFAQEPKTTAFVNVNVIPMETEQVLENQTVVVEGDRIIIIGPADEVTVPAVAQVIEGDGAYLMPGLADMHIHFADVTSSIPGTEEEERPLKL